MKLNKTVWLPRELPSTAGRVPFERRVERVLPGADIDEAVMSPQRMRKLKERGIIADEVEPEVVDRAKEDAKNFGKPEKEGV